MSESVSENGIEKLPEAVKANPKPWLFQKGHSPTRGAGRPKLDTTVRNAFRAEGLNSLKVLVELRDNTKTPANVRAACCNAILDRGFGKPREAPEVTEDSQATYLSAEDIDELLG